MPTPESSLSVAIQGLAEFIDGKFDEDVVVTVDTPQKAHESAKSASTEILNVFAYRIAPSGFHAGDRAEDPFFIRANVLLTAFLRGRGDAAPDAGLRVLGHAVRVLQSFPVIPVTFPGPAPGTAPANDFRNGPTTDYQMQAVMQAPTMEEINHIWTTQGGELSYRLSAAYELALIPIEPISHAAADQAVQSAELVMGAGPSPRPFQMLSQGDRLFSHLELPPGAPSVELVLTGVVNSQVAVQVQWERAGGGSDSQPSVVLEVATIDVEHPTARHTLGLVSAAQGDRATILALPSSSDGTLTSGATPANLLHITIGA